MDVGHIFLGGTNVLSCLAVLKFNDSIKSCDMLVFLPGFKKGRVINSFRAGSSFGQKRAICVVQEKTWTEFHYF
jgi:hypothetical protein